LGNGSDKASWVTGINTWFGNVFRHHAASPYHHMVANIYRQYGGIAANAHMVSNVGGFPFRGIAAGGSSGAEQIVYEHHSMSYKTMITDGDQLTHEAVALHPGVLPHHHAALNFAKWAYEGMIANGTSIKVYGLNYFYIVSKNYVSNSNVQFFC
jgi:hypothetical protein